MGIITVHICAVLNDQGVRHVGVEHDGVRRHQQRSAHDSLKRTTKCNICRPQRSCGKTMFSQASVILFTEEDGRPPWVDTSLRWLLQQTVHIPLEHGSHFSGLIKLPDFSLTLSVFFSIFQYFFNVSFFQLKM